MHMNVITDIDRGSPDQRDGAMTTRYKFFCRRANGWTCTILIMLSLDWRVGIGVQGVSSLAGEQVD